MFLNIYKLFQDPTFFHWSLFNPVLELHCLNLLWLCKDLCIWLSPATLFYFFLIFKSSLHGLKIKGYKTIVCQQTETTLGILMLCCAVLYCLAQSCLTLCKFIDCSPPGSSVHGDSPGKNTGVGCHAFLQHNLPQLGIKPRSPEFQADSVPGSGIEPGSPTLQADSLPEELPGKPRCFNRWVSILESRQWRI